MLRTQQRREGGALKTTRSVERVLEHIPAAEQLPLTDLDNDLP